MNLDDFKFVRLSEEHEIKQFDCGDSDLNDFLFNDAKKYQKVLLTVTYLIESDSETVAFFSLLNDKITYELELKGNKKIWNSFNRKLPNKKRSYSGYPAMKIARLGVTNNIISKGLGSQILDFLKKWFTNGNRTGCRFFTVDAYNNSKTLNFYLKNDFKFLTDDESDVTRLMYFNLENISRK